MPTHAARSAESIRQLQSAVEAIVAHAGPSLVVAAPLGLGKPHRLLNALYLRVAADPALTLNLQTALSLAVPSPGKGLEQRFLRPFIERHFGAEFIGLDYVAAQKQDRLPANIAVEEFYFQSGALLGSLQAQASYTCLNYTHVARAVAERGVNVLVQKVAREPGGTKLSLSCNPDLSQDLVDEVARRAMPRPFLVAEVDPALPYLGGSAAVDAEFFDLVLEGPEPSPRLFALPRQPVSDADHAIGLYASTLVADGGTLQIGIGSLSDALCHALILRHTDNAAYLQVLAALDPALAGSALVREVGGTAPFAQGLYGASEMVNDGFMRLSQAGILKRRVLDDIGVMQRANAGTASAEDQAALEADGHWLDGGFYLGSHDLYQWLRQMPPAQARGLGMTRISHINELYGGNETLERLQRRDARFFNTCMMMTALGSAVSDALGDGRVVSGVGGQYNFVAMAHALRDGRSVLMLRATRDDQGQTRSNLLWNYPHCTIPRHLRDIAVTEYGIADLRTANDEDCCLRMLALTDARFQPALAAQARKSRKLRAHAPMPTTENSAARLHATLAQFRQRGLLPDYPLGCDFSADEQRLVPALAWLKKSTAGRIAKLRTLLRALMPGAAFDHAAMQRMRLDKPTGLNERLQARLLALALRQTATAPRLPPPPHPP